MSILAMFRKIILYHLFLGLFCKRLLLKTINQVQYILGSRVIQQAATTNGVDLYWRIDLLNFLWSNIYTMDRVTD